MNCISNCLMMSNTLDAQEIALEKLRNVLIIFEKKKRNLDKKKNKLDEYKKKKDLNEDQQKAVSKYQEVIANLELVDELNTLALQQVKDAEKYFKKAKKQEKVEIKRNEAFLIEFVMKTYYLLDRIINNEQVQSKLLTENYIEPMDLNLFRELFYEIHISDVNNWKRLSEQLQSLYKGGTKPLELNSLDDQFLLRSTSKDDILKCMGKISNIDWLNSSDWDQHLKETVYDIKETAENKILDTDTINDEIMEHIEEQPIIIKETEVVSPPESMGKISVQPENLKLNFVFIHESIVQEDGAEKGNETTYTSNGFNNDQDHGQRSSSQMSSKGLISNNSNANNTWHTIDDNPVDDVFSSATQSEFMHSENSRNLKPRGQRLLSNSGRFRSRGSPSQHVFALNREAQLENVNYWKSNNRGGGSFNANPRYMRSSRGTSRGRGRHPRSDNRQSSDEMEASIQ